MPIAKIAKKERYSILIASLSDARKKPFALRIGKAALIGALTAVLLLTAAGVCALSCLFVRSAQARAEMGALRDLRDGQAARIAAYAMALDSLRASIARAADASARRDVLPVTQTQPAAQLTARQETTPRAQAKQTAPAIAEKQAPPSSYNGKIGDRFALKNEAAALSVAAETYDYSSSNIKVARVSGQGDIVLTGPGKASISVSEDGEKKTVCKITCDYPFNSVHYCQSDRRWRFSSATKRRACVVSSFAIMLENAGVPATPRTVYNANRSLSLRFKRLKKAFGIDFVNALDGDSPYLECFDGSVTTIRDPSKNYVAAVKEALNRHPEGVCVYFRGRGGHMMVAVGYVGDVIYYSDPGRVKSKGHMVGFDDTWVYHGHGMRYRHFRYMVAIDALKTSPPAD